MIDNYLFDVFKKSKTSQYASGRRLKHSYIQDQEIISLI